VASVLAGPEDLVFAGNLTKLVEGTLFLKVLRIYVFVRRGIGEGLGVTFQWLRDMRSIPNNGHDRLPGPKEANFCKDFIGELSSLSTWDAVWLGLFVGFFSFLCFIFKAMTRAGEHD
jgi:hypothetical protein